MPLESHRSGQPTKVHFYGQVKGSDRRDRLGTIELLDLLPPNLVWVAVELEIEAEPRTYPTHSDTKDGCGESLAVSDELRTLQRESIPCVAP